MSVEHAIVVRVPGSEETEHLCRDIASSRRRARKALPGDRVDVVRFEALSTQLERLGTDAVRGGAEQVELPPADRLGLPFFAAEDLDALPAEVAGPIGSWLVAGDCAVEIRDPLVLGPTALPAPDADQAPVAERWSAPAGEQGRRAVAVRFKCQLERVTEGRPDAAIAPSGVSNSVLTEGLREYVAGGGEERIDAPVSYRDGSSGHPFPLRVLPLGADPPASNQVLRLALLSIRHTEMDVEVDGAWLRNTEISRLRPAGETDALVHALSRRQLVQLAESGPTTIFMYQTGLETAVIGFYRALTEHLLEHPGSVAVVPMFFRRQRAPARTLAGGAQESHFAEGEPWAM